MIVLMTEYEISVRRRQLRLPLVDPDHPNPRTVPRFPMIRSTGRADPKTGPQLGARHSEMPVCRGGP